MAKKLLINAIEPRELRAAILGSNGEIVNLFIERAGRKYQKGDIYKARVLSIESHLQAAFVELEPSQHGFLSISDIILPDGGNWLYDESVQRPPRPGKAEDESASEGAAPEAGLAATESPEVPVALGPVSPESGSPSAPVSSVSDEDETKLEIIEEEVAETEQREEGGEGEVESESGFEASEEGASGESERPNGDSEDGPRGESGDGSAAKASGESEAGATEGDRGGAVKAKSAGGDDDGEGELVGRPKRGDYPKIDEVIKPGQELVVQIIKEGIGKKAPVVSTYLSLAGRFVVMTVGNERRSISRKIRSSKERDRLHSVIDKAKLPDGCGLIVRTAAVDVPKKDLQTDLKNLGDFWDDLKAGAKRERRPAVLYKEAGLITRLMRDYYEKDVDEVLVDTQEAMNELKVFFEEHMPDEFGKLKLHQGDPPLFERFKLEEQIRSVFKSRVPLPGGGGLVFEQTEAMLTIDVNSGTFREGKDDDETAFNINMIAAREIAQQVQLRDVGGLIMIDFVDMRRSSSRRQVMRELEHAFESDKSKINITRISELGVLEMTRQRTRDSLRNTLHSACEVCSGTGMVPGREYLAMGMLRLIRSHLPRYRKDTMKVYATAAIAIDLLNGFRGELHAMEESGGVDIQILIDATLPVGGFYLGVKPKPDEDDRGDGRHRRGRDRDRSRRGGRGGNWRGHRDRDNLIKEETRMPLGIIRDEPRPPAPPGEGGTGEVQHPRSQEEPREGGRDRNPRSQEAPRGSGGGREHHHRDSSPRDPSHRGHATRGDFRRDAPRDASREDSGRDAGRDRGGLAAGPGPDNRAVGPEDRGPGQESSAADSENRGPGQENRAAGPENHGPGQEGGPGGDGNWPRRRRRRRRRRRGGGGGVGGEGGGSGAGPQNLKNEPGGDNPPPPPESGGGNT